MMFGVTTRVWTERTKTNVQIMKIKLFYMLLCFYSLSSDVIPLSFSCHFSRKATTYQVKHTKTPTNIPVTLMHIHIAVLVRTFHIPFITFIPYPLTLTLILTTAWIISTLTLKQPFVKQSKMAPAL